MFSVNRKTMKLPANSNIENPIYLGGVPKCTITHLRVFTNMGPNLLSATRTCFGPVPQVIRQFHTSSISSLPTNSETHSIHVSEEKNMNPNKLTCQDLPHQIMMTYAEVVKSVSRQLPKQFQEMIPPPQDKTVKSPCSQMITKSCQILPKLQNFCNTTQNSRCPWRVRNNHSNNNFRIERNTKSIENNEVKKGVRPFNTSDLFHPKPFERNSPRPQKSSESTTPRPLMSIKPTELAPSRPLMGLKSSEMAPARPQMNIKPELAPPRPLMSIKSSELASPRPLMGLKSSELAPPRPLMSMKSSELASPRPLMGLKSSELAPPRPLMSLKSSELASPRPLMSQRVGNPQIQSRSCPKVPDSFSRRPRRRRRNKFWQTSPRVLSSNWRESTPVPEMSSKVQENIPIEPESVDRDRKQSESSQASEDSWVVFEPDSGCSYDSEVSSQPSSDSESDTETGSEDSDSPIPTDSGHNSESDEEIFLKVGDGESVSLPPKVRLPPLISSSRSSSSLNEESEDSDDDWIVFQSDSEDEIDAKEKTEEIQGERRTRVKMVRFAEKEETCYLYDDDDYRAARCGEWEEKARDRTRFRARIMSTAEVIAPILNPEHRRKIMQSRLS